MSQDDDGPLAVRQPCSERGRMPLAVTSPGPVLFLESMWSTEIFVIIGLVFLLGGFVKGVVGFGLPTVALALLAATIDVKAAIALLAIPALATNIWQALIGDSLRVLLRRLWSFLLLISIAIWFGAGVLARTDAALITALLGLLLCAYGAATLAKIQIAEPGKRELWLSPLVGAVNGIVTGLTGTFVVPSVIYLQALRLPRDALIQAMGLTYMVSSLMLAVSLGGHALLTAELGLISSLALAPALLGMALGQRLRQRLPEERFRQIFLAAIILLGLYLMLRQLF